MCMLFGLNARRRFEVKGVLKEFFEYSCVHPDGWGICTYQDSENSNLVKEAVPAYKSYILSRMLEESVTGKTILAHIRKKTFGQVSIKNTHPFQKDNWVLAHNGSVNIPGAYLNGGNYKADGETDSERILCFIMNNLQEQELLGTKSMELIMNIEKSIQEISQFGKLNLLLANGDLMIVYSNAKGTLYQADVENGSVVFCTKPISRKLIWREVPNNIVFVYQDGAMIYKGKVKRNVNYDDIFWRRQAIHNEWSRIFY